MVKGEKKIKVEVPDVSWWNSCFTLFERAMEWSGHSREAELVAYREFISSMAQSRQWEQVQNYDREFRKAAARQKDVSRAEVNSTLFVTEMIPWQPVVLGMKRMGDSEGGSKKRLRESGGQAGGTFGMRRVMGPCFRYNKGWGVIRRDAGSDTIVHSVEEC